jgi:hypothetical protein
VLRSEDSFELLEVSHGFRTFAARHESERSAAFWIQEDQALQEQRTGMDFDALILELAKRSIRNETLINRAERQLSRPATTAGASRTAHNLPLTTRGPPRPTFGVAERESIAVLIDCEDHVALVHELIIPDLEHF